jgi:hypothetical protein
MTQQISQDLIQGSISSTAQLLGQIIPSRTVRMICWDKADCAYAEKWLADCLLIAIDIETIPYDKKKPNFPFVITIVTYSGIQKDGSIRSFCFPFQNGKSPVSGAPAAISTIITTVGRINANPVRKCFQNGVYDCAWFLYYCLPVKNYAYDSMSLWWSKYPDLPRRLDFIASIVLDDYQYWKAGRKSEDFLEYCDYGMADTEYTLRIVLKLVEEATKDSAMRLNFFHAHMRCMTGLWMSAQGIAVDEATMADIAKTLDEEAAKALARLRSIVRNPNFNPNSPPQKKHLIYGILGAKFRNAKGRYVKRIEDASTGAIVLRSIRADHPIHRRVANAVLEAIAPAKQTSNVVGIVRFPAGSTGSRFLNSYDGVGTTTSRLASRASAFGHGSNAQNVRKDYRKFGIADKGCFLIEIDFSASDDVFVAFESREQKKIDLVRSGLDTHATNALIFFKNWTYEGIVAGKNAKDPKVVHPITGVRQITKKVVHGCHYLMAGMTLYMSAGREAIVAAALESGYEDAGRWTQEQLVEFCAELDHAFRLHYPRFQREHDSADSWYRELRAEVRSTGGFTTPFRYFQRFLSDPNDDSTLRAVAATAGQAGTAGRINMVMDELCHGYIPKYLRDGINPNFGDEPRLIGQDRNGIAIRLQTHDSISFNVDPKNPGWLSGLEGVFHSFERPIIIHGEEVRVGIEADVSIHWAGKEGITVKKPVDIIPWLDEMGLKYAA